jgi:hypothetical protein
MREYLAVIALENQISQCYDGPRQGELAVSSVLMIFEFKKANP